MLGLLSGTASRWIRRQERIFHPLGRGLTPAERSAFAGFFDAALLARVRIHRLERHRTAASLFRLSHSALLIPFRLRNIIAITFGNAVVVAHPVPLDGPTWERLLFHELVHVVQYDLLGIDEFINRYLSGWVRARFRYPDIPLERDARALEMRFARDPATAFPVRAAVQEQLGMIAR